VLNASTQVSYTRPHVPSGWLREALHDIWPRAPVVGALGGRTSSSPA